MALRAERNSCMRAICGSRMHVYAPMDASVHVYMYASVHVTCMRAICGSRMECAAVMHVRVRARSVHAHVHVHCKRMCVCVRVCVCAWVYMCVGVPAASRLAEIALACDG